MAWARGTSPVVKLKGGYNSDVYKVGDSTVLKVDKDSVGLSRRERRRLASQMRDEHQALLAYVGPVVLPHSIDIGPHPKHRFMQAVRITQPFVDIDFLKLNEEWADVPVLVDRLHGAQATCPAILDEISSMVIGSRALFAEQQLSTDLIGNDNIGIAPNKHLTLVDAQPVNGQYGDAQAKLQVYFDNLEEAVRLAA